MLEVHALVYLVETCLCPKKLDVIDLRVVVPGLAGDLNVVSLTEDLSSSPSNDILSVLLISCC